MYVNIVYFDLLLLRRKNLNLSITRSQNADDAQGHLDFENAFRTCYIWIQGQSTIGNYKEDS